MRFLDKLLAQASHAGAAGLNLGSGVDPTTPIAGDLWATATALKVFLSGSVKTLLFSDSTLPAANLTGTLPALDGADLTGLTATQVGALPIAGGQLTGGVRFAVYTTAGLPSAATAGFGTVVNVSDGARPGPRVSDGTSWIEFGFDPGAVSGVMSTPRIVEADPGTDNATYTLPYLGSEEFAWKSGAIQDPDLDYTRVGAKITFKPGKVPIPGYDFVMLSASRSAIDTDAMTLASAAPAVVATPDAIVKTTSAGTIDPSMLPDPGSYAEPAALTETCTLNTDGTLATVTWKEGATTVKTLTYTYNADKTVATKVYVVGSVTTTHTYTYGAGTMAVSKAVS